ncbi:MAG: L-aspartate oxidase [Bacteroidetes bacterium]|jgi:L-aspartate oxidase|nr:L-aspartate oxidase [Bacteroidota bacterium]MBT6685220.1 L-aspartate oxidase [Bacteroidota bacterium]MBT7142288.1 L-aspartate oxidase [Bacteroidota bacterium]MBT7492254.1 L-aspartate oxidase [Bacteroidota bacterium]
MKTFDFLIVGSGIAGLSYALKVAKFGRVGIISKTTFDETNTKYAQGGIAAVTYQPDSFKKHISDTIKAGDGLCDNAIVKNVVSEAQEQIQELINIGANFDKKPNGMFDLAKEGGHSEHRILHHKDNTGFEIQRALTEKVKNHPNIEIFDFYFAIDIITQHHLNQTITRRFKDIECYGLYALNLKTNQIRTFLSKIVFIASGGIGNIYQTTTNPSIATGDGVAMVYRAKGAIENMEFVQFHPTSLYNPNERPSFLITEALRGFGAKLKTANGKEFMHKYDKRESLAPRDIVARAIDNEIKTRGDEFVYLDATHLDGEKLISNFPNIHQKCLKLGIDITKDLIPVVPAAHYLCGGIVVDENGLTSIKNLFAAGEVTSTGMHGANRLASNSLLEAVVFANRASKVSIKNISKIQVHKYIPNWDDAGTSHPEEMVLITQNLKELQQIMTNYVGIVRSNLRLKRAMDRLDIIYRETEDLFKKSIVSAKLCELRNAINVAYIIIRLALKRKESRGLHYTIDYRRKNIK